MSKKLNFIFVIGLFLGNPAFANIAYNCHYNFTSSEDGKNTHYQVVVIDGTNFYTYMALNAQADGSDLQSHLVNTNNREADAEQGTVSTLANGFYIINGLKGGDDIRSAYDKATYASVISKVTAQISASIYTGGDNGILLITNYPVKKTKKPPTPIKMDCVKISK